MAITFVSTKKKLEHHLRAIEPMLFHSNSVMGAFACGMLTAYAIASDTWPDEKTIKEILGARTMNEARDFLLLSRFGIK